MFPSNSYMDPYLSQNKEQIPYPLYPFYPYPVPNRPDPSAQSASYTPWPYQFNPTHSNGYSYPPGYYGPRPPFPYELPPPNFPNYYHPYFTPMPNYPAQYPQIDHTKSQTHCCGCPNHVCNGTHSPKVKIDEEKHDVDQRKIPNNAYPYFWFSPRNNVQQDEIEKQKEEKREAQFPWPIVWMPEDEVKEKEKRDTQFPWPLIWRPEDDAKETKHQHANKRVSEEAAKPSFRIIPLKFLEHGDKDEADVPKIPVVEKKQGGEEAGKERRDCGDKDQAAVKIIPVMEKKEVGEKVGKEQPVKESTRDKMMEKKNSKLPPVCLRVDPLRHKKPTNGSPKEDKNKKEVKVLDVKGAKDERKEREVEVNKDLKEERKIDDVKRVSMPKEDKIKKEIKVSMPKEDKIKKEIKVVDARGAEGREFKERHIQGEDLKEKLEERKVESVKRAKISEQDAAVLIQSVYRGYNVRRWDPLEKLKKIRSVHEKAQELMGRLQHLEESAIQLEKKDLLVLSETIMSLLLQLDTIQGLHPTVREARKSVARELVSLQEKLDSLEKLKAVGTQTNEVQQSQLEVQPTARTSDGCKLVSEQVDSPPSEAPTMESMATQKGDEKAHESLEGGSAVELDTPQSATHFHPIGETLVKKEDDACGALESYVTPLPGDTEPTNPLPETLAGENNLKTQSPQTKNAELHAAEVAPDFHPIGEMLVKNEDDACGAPESHVSPLPGDTEPTDLLPETIADENNLKAQSPHTESVELHATEVAPDFHPIGEMLVKNEDDACGAPESHVTPLPGDTEPTDLLQETIADGNNIKAQSPQTENVELHATEVAPSIAEESNTTELTPVVTSFESSTDASHVLSESEVHDAAVISSGTEDIHGTGVAPEVVANDGVNPAATIPETNNLGEDGYVEKAHIHATESDAKRESAPEVESETTAKEVDLKEAVVAQEDSHESDAGANVENFEFQAIKNGEPSNEENKVEDNDIAPDAAVAASPEVKMHATEFLPEESCVSDNGASAEKVELLATEVGKLEQNKSVEQDEVTTISENEVTSLPENENPDGFQEREKLNEHQAEVHPNLIQTDAMEATPEVTSTDDATEAGKVGLEEKKVVEENEKLRDMLERLLEAGRNQLDVISGLNDRVKGLEKRLERKSKKGKVRVKKHKPAMAS